MSYQLEEIVKSKNKAFAVLLKTRKQLEEVAGKAHDFLTKNRGQIQSYQDEITDLTLVNSELLKHIAGVEKSIDETDRILNPHL